MGNADGSGQRATVDVLLLDLDGVVRVWDPQGVAEAERLAGLPAGAIRGVAFARDLLHPAITGRVRDEQWRRQIVERLRAAFPEADGERAVALWSEPAGAVDRAALEVVRACRRRVPVVLVTNATSRLERDLERLGLTGEFDHVVNSSAVGWIKPQGEIFEAALGMARVSPPRALFVDVTAENVAAAAGFGIRAHLYQDADRLRLELGWYGLL
jgi:putative hydrolase of the HAD superfamily